jgi:hypothetical protein
MKKLLFAATSLLAFNQAFAGYQYLTCEAFRISQDTNLNVQAFRVDKDLGVEINGVKLTEAQWIDGSLNDIYPGIETQATYASLDGNGNYKIVMTVLSTVAEAHGHLNIGRDHDFDVYQVRAVVSRGNKTHEFIGTCTSELLSTCGGACQPESEIRDVL